MIFTICILETSKVLALILSWMKIQKFIQLKRLVYVVDNSKHKISRRKSAKTTNVEDKYPFT